MADQQLSKSAAAPGTQQKEPPTDLKSATAGQKQGADVPVR